MSLHIGTAPGGPTQPLAHRMLMAALQARTQSCDDGCATPAPEPAATPAPSPAPSPTTAPAPMSESLAAMFKALASAADADQDGIVSSSELDAAGLSDTAKAMLTSTDADHDGLLTAEELATLEGFASEVASYAVEDAAPVDEPPPPPPAPPSLYDEFTANHDADGDGKITQAELQGSWAGRLLADAFGRIDGNDDGSLDEAELDHFQARMQEARAQFGLGFIPRAQNWAAEMAETGATAPTDPAASDCDCASDAATLKQAMFDLITSMTEAVESRIDDRRGRDHGHHHGHDRGEHGGWGWGRMITSIRIETSQTGAFAA